MPMADENNVHDLREPLITPFGSRHWLIGVHSGDALRARVRRVGAASGRDKE